MLHWFCHMPMFVDADFMPCDESLFQKSSNDQPAVMWKRPEDFCKGAMAQGEGVPPRKLVTFCMAHS